MNVTHSIILLVAALLAVFFEATFNLPRRLLGAQIDLLPALVVYASLSSNFVTVVLVATLGGLWFDTLSFNPLGVSLLPLYVIGFVIYPRRVLIMREQYYAQFVLGLAASALTPLFTLLILLSTRQVPVLGWGTLWQWLVMSIGGGLLTPLCFQLFDGINRILSYRPSGPGSFRPDREIKRGRN